MNIEELQKESVSILNVYTFRCRGERFIATSVVDKMNKNNPRTVNKHNIKIVPTDSAEPPLNEDTEVFKMAAGAIIAKESH